MPFHVLRHKSSAPIEVIEMLPEVQVVEEEDCTSYGLRKEIVFDHDWYFEV